ncbi:hypothetical protein ACHQM5_022002 [Ranunculus cassubicifolius]
MAYRRRQGISRASTFKEEIHYNPPTSPPPPQQQHDEDAGTSSSTTGTSSSLAAQAIRASSAHRDSSLSSAYRESAFANRESDRNKSFPAARSTDSTSYEYTSMKNLNETKDGFWGVLARKAKSILDDDNVAQQFNKSGRAGNQMHNIPSDEAYQHSYQYQSPESNRKPDNPSLQKGLDAITSSLNYIGKSFEVAMAMTAKAKLLLRELKTVKADLAFAKERCNQLEEENKILRESREKGDRPEDDDLIRLQLETLLAEKGRLANENSIYARENRFLREIVEYHQLTMQDVVYLDEGIEEVTEVYPSINIPLDAQTRTRSLSPPPPMEEAKAVSPSISATKDISTVSSPIQEPTTPITVKNKDVSSVFPTPPPNATVSSPAPET